MDSHFEYEALLDALSTSIAEVPTWQGFLCAARDALGADHAAIVYGLWAERKEADPVFFVDAPHSQEAAEAFYQAYMASGRTGTGEACCQTTPAAPGSQTMINGLTLQFEENGRTIHVLFWRRAGGERFSEASRHLLTRLMTPLKRGIRVFERIVNLERRQIVLNAAIETADIGVILATADGEPLLTNSIADTLLNQKDGLQLVRGRLRAVNQTDTASLLTHIRCMAAEQQAEHDWQIYTPLALARETNPLPLTVIVRPGPAFRPLKKPLLRTAMLVLRDPGRRPIIPSATLARLFGLTPAESLLASELARGASLDEAATNLSISRNTARTQLQSVFMKTGVNRQGELVRMLLTSAAALSR